MRAMFMHASNVNVNETWLVTICDCEIVIDWYNVFLTSKLSSMYHAWIKTKTKKKDKKEEETSWDVSNPGKDFKYKTHGFSTDEGTWMNLDVAPDGKTIVFDLLGDIYAMPIEGGKATCIRGGLAMEVQPRFSPDGKRILFTSDAGGGDNIWMMDKDGSHATQITKENFRLLNNAVWTPDGEYLIARKHFTSHRSAPGVGDLKQCCWTAWKILKLNL